MELVPIKVKILKKKNGYLDYPDFKHTLAVFDKSDYKAPPIHLDRTSDCKTDSPHSPEGEMCGLKLVDSDFADEALAAFPARVTKLTEAEAKDFWENRAMVNVPENKIDINELQGLKAQYEIMTILGQPTSPLITKMAKAIDPNDDTPGIKKDDEKLWDDMKTKKGITIKKAVEIE